MVRLWVPSVAKVNMMSELNMAEYRMKIESGMANFSHVVT